MSCSGWIISCPSIPAAYARGSASDYGNFVFQSHDVCPRNFRLVMRGLYQRYLSPSVSILAVACLGHQGIGEPGYVSHLRPLQC